MNGTYNHLLVIVSLVVAMLASYTALDLTARIRSLQAAGSKRAVWLFCGAAVMGTGIWSMHFIGMLAMQMPMVLGYDLWITALSLLIAIGLSYFALSIISGTAVSYLRLALGGLGMGIAIAAMHYTGMAALRIEPALTYNRPLFCLSIAIALTASWAALWIASMLSNEAQHRVLLKRGGASVIMGFAIAGMHYTGMSAAIFSAHAVSRAASLANADWLAAVVAGTTLILLTSTLIFSRIDRTFDAASNRMGASLNQANQQLLALATQDSLTTLPNRASLLERMEQMISRAEREGRPFTVIFTDLDGFKTINDSLGHAAGDDLLIKFSRHLNACVRREDMVSRLGGDEFVVLLDGLGLPADVSPIANNILCRMQQSFIVGGTPLRVTASIGVASYPQDGKLAEELLKNADMAMYDAKQNGKNTFRFYDCEMSKAASRTSLIYSALSEELLSSQLTLHFQPKFDRIKEKLIGAEALLRWHHPKLGNIPPLEFIPIAERTGRIVELGNWVICEACKHITEWDRKGMSPVKIAINLSPEQLCLPGYIDTVLSITRAAGVHPNRIMFEITETAAMRDAKLSADVLRQFQKVGFDIAIDDFGTGYSSLAYLQQFRVKQLKIDRFFTNGLDHNGTEGLAIVSAIIAMAHSLNMVVVAEGVETMTQLTALKGLSCDEFQGFYLGKPKTAAEFTALVQQKEPSLTLA